MKLFNIFLYSLLFFAITSVITILYTPPISQKQSSSSSSSFLKLKALMKMKKSARKSAAAPPPPQLEPYDYLMLAKTWPPAFCKAHTCYEINVPDPLRFTLHGLWPGKYQGDQQRDCTKITAKFDSTKVGTHLVAELEKKWPNMRKNANIMKLGLWIDQWNIHGSCTGMDQTMYYNLAMAMADKVDIRAILKLKGKEPTSEKSKGHGPIKRSQIAKDLFDHFQFKPQLDCVEVKNILYLMEVRLCFDRTNTEQMINCSTMWTRSCYKEDIFYIL